MCGAPSFGGLCRSEGPHRENWPAFPAWRRRPGKEHCAGLGPRCRPEVPFRASRRQLANEWRRRFKVADRPASATTPRGKPIFRFRHETAPRLSAASVPERSGGGADDALRFVALSGPTVPTGWSNQPAARPTCPRRVIGRDPVPTRTSRRLTPRKDNSAMTPPFRSSASIGAGPTICMPAPARTAVRGAGPFPTGARARRRTGKPPPGRSVAKPRARGSPRRAV